MTQHHVPEEPAPESTATVLIGVTIAAGHTCMSLRGVRAAGTRSVTSALLGTLRTDAASRAKFLSLTRGAGRGCRA